MNLFDVKFRTNLLSEPKQRRSATGFTPSMTNYTNNGMHLNLDSFHFRYMSVSICDLTNSLEDLVKYGATLLIMVGPHIRAKAISEMQRWTGHFSITVPAIVVQLMRNPCFSP